MNCFVREKKKREINGEFSVCVYVYYPRKRKQGIKEEDSKYCLLLYDSVLLKVEVEKRSLA
jgi:hypothetical protein